MDRKSKKPFIKGFLCARYTSLLNWLCDKSRSKDKNAKYEKGTAGTAGKDWI